MSSRSEYWLKATALCALLLGALLRLLRAYTLVLNPDEALHLLPCYSDSFTEAMRLISADTHPPVHSAVTCILRPFLYGELAARLFGVLAGLMLPVVLYFWLRERLSLAAACAALTVTALWPGLVNLSAEIRSYALAMVLVALVLLWLDQGITKASQSRIALAGATLVVAILTDYSVLMVCAAIALYGAARLWESRSPARAWWLWAGCQVLALGVLVAIYWFHIRHLQTVPTDYGVGGYPVPGQMLAVFWASGFLKQFAYLTGAVSVGVLFALIYLLAFLSTTLSWRILLLTPFVTGLALSMLRLFPFGRTRHSSVIAIFIAVGIGLAAHRWSASRSRIGPWSAPLIVVLGFVLMQENPLQMAAPLQVQQEIRGAPAYLSKLASTGVPIFVTGEAWVLVDAYRSMQHLPPFPLEHRKDWGIPPERVESEFALFRRRHAIPPHEPVYFVEGGFGPFVFPNPQPSKMLRTFGTLRVWAIHEYGHSAAGSATR